MQRANMDSRTFPVLLENARAGQPDACGEILELQRQMLSGVAARIIPHLLLCKCDADDLVQETFTKAFQVFEEFAGSSPEELRRWLVTICRDRLADELRFYRRAKRDIRRQVAFPDLQGASATVDARQQRAEAVCATSERTGALNRHLADLTPNKKQVLTMRFQDKCSWRKIGGALGCTAGQARKTGERALAILEQFAELNPNA